MSGFEYDPRPSFCPSENLGAREWQSEYGDSELVFEISSFQGMQSSNDASRTSSEDSKSETLTVVHEGKKMSSSSSSLFAGDGMDYKPGWPLLLRACSATPSAKLARNMSVVQWVMNLPSRSPHHTPRCSTNKEIELSGNGGKDNSSNSSMQYELQKCLEIPLRRISTFCQWFSYEVLKAATAEFSSGFYPFDVFCFAFCDHCF